MNESMSITAPVTIPVWAVAAIALGLFFAVLWAALPVLMRRTNPRWPFATSEQNLVLSIIVVLGVLLFLGAVLSAFAVLLHTFQTASRSGDGPNLGAGALIAALLGAPFVIWGTVLKWQTVRYQKEGHMTDRISKAVEQLGTEKTVKKGDNEETVPNLEVRMGAILSLERIAQDSTMHDKGRDHVRVMQILCAYIRHNAPSSNANNDDPRAENFPKLRKIRHERGPEQTRDLWVDIQVSGLDRVPFEKIHDWGRAIPSMRMDVQLALRVIGTRTSAQKAIEHGLPLNEYMMKRIKEESFLSSIRSIARLGWSGINEAAKRSQADRSPPTYRLDLRGVNFQKSELTEYDFSYADLRYCRFDFADMKNSVFVGAQMEWCTFTRSDISGATFFEANLSSSHFFDCTAFKARFQLSGLQMAFFNGGVFSGSDFSGSFLSAVSMSVVNLTSVCFSGAYTSNFRIVGSGGDFTCFYSLQFDEFSQLKANRLRLASLRGSELEKIPPSECDISMFFGDGSVNLPVGVMRPDFWPRQILDDAAFTTELARWRASPSTYTPPKEG